MKAVRSTIKGLVDFGSLTTLEATAALSATPAKGAKYLLSADELKTITWAFSALAASAIIVA